MPKDIRRQAWYAFKKCKNDPYQASLQFKKVQEPDGYSARINDDYRVMGVWEGDTIIWVWIGKHGDYDKLI